MTAWDGLNRRKFPRINFPCLVIVKFTEGEQENLLTHTENVGIGGICVILKKGLKVFTPVDVEIDLLDTQDHVKCKGKVVWAIQRRNAETKKPLFYDIGIEFIDLKEPDLHRIQATVEHFVKKGFKTPYR